MGSEIFRIVKSPIAPGRNFAAGLAEITGARAAVCGGVNAHSRGIIHRKRPRPIPTPEAHDTQGALLHPPLGGAASGA